MKTLIESSTWYIAATHYLTSGFVIPGLLGVTVSYVLKNIGITDLTPIMNSLLLTVVWILGLSGGVFYSVSYLKKTYILKDISKIIRFSTAYFIIFNIIYLLINFITILKTGATTASITIILINTLSFIISAIIFYLLSIRALKK